MIKFICYPRCTTCQKAKKWLEENKIPYTERNIKEENPTFDELKDWHGKSKLPIRKLFNTSGLLYRSLNLKERLPGMSEEEALRLLSTDGMLVKRPLIVADDYVLVGFRQEEWAETTGISANPQ